MVGEEISTLNGHLLGLWLAERVPQGLTALRTIELIHAQGGLAVAAHPFHPLRGAARGHRSLGALVPDLPLDGLEVVNNAGVFSRLYDAWAALRNVEWMLPVTGGSDAHDVWYLVGAAQAGGAPIALLAGHPASHAEAVRDVRAVRRGALSVSTP